MTFDAALVRVGRVHELIDEHHQDPSASVLPLRRALMAVIDDVPAHSGPMQLSVAFRAPGQVPSVVDHHLRVAIEAACFGHWLGLPPLDLSHLALAGAMRVSVSSPDAVVRTLAGRSDLGAALGPVLMLVRDAILARQGGEVSDGGRILALAQTWVALVDGTRRTPPRSPRTARELLGGGRVRWLPAALASAFARFKGPLPLGAPVELAPGGLGIVVSRPPTSPGGRPVVMRADGVRVDLVERPEVAVVRAPEPHEPAVMEALRALFALL